MRSGDLVLVHLCADEDGPSVPRFNSLDTMAASAGPENEVAHGLNILPRMIVASPPSWNRRSGCFRLRRVGPPTR